jgi:murein DD-endopeptidase MepM/ murein hydrolase activator NlpD
MLACIIWSVAATCGYLHRTNEAGVKQREILIRTAELAGLRQNYQAAFGRLDEFESLFSGISCEISDIQDSLLKMAEHDSRHEPMPRLDADPNGCRNGIVAQGGDGTGPQPSSVEGGGTDRIVGALPARSPSAAIDPEELRRRVNHLGDALDKLRASHNAFLQYSAVLTEQRIAELERTLASVGMDGHRVGKSGLYGQGGPFIAALPGKAIPDTFDPVALFNLHADRLDSLNSVLRSLPLAAPLVDYELTSPFGARNDPINEMTGIHEGVDLGAPPGTPVKATGDGTVTWAGWRDRYGMLVEIEHGMGIKTRYAHLSRVLVKVGEHVARGANVGLVGETGRTTGPHLHYEVRIGDQAVNPMKFFSAGEHVLKAK